MGVSAVKEAKKTLITVGITIGVIVLLIVVGVGSWLLSAFVNRPVEEEKNYSIREEVVPVAKLVANEYNFTQILYYSSVNADNPLSIEIPFSENKYIATIEGDASIFVDTELITFEPHYNVANVMTSVDVSLPHCEVKQPVTLNYETLTILENRDGLLNVITDEQKNRLLVDTNAEQIEKIQNSGLLEKADVRVQELISTQLKILYGQDLEINYQYIGE